MIPSVSLLDGAVGVLTRRCRRCFDSMMPSVSRLVRTQDVVREENMDFVSACCGCQEWKNCKNCSISNPDTVYLCADLLEHTSSPDADGTLASLSLDEGYWRSSNVSMDIRECHLRSACVGGQASTCGDVNCVQGYCATGYTGPCELRALHGRCLLPWPR